jgi:Carboxypeptidase regulatory-like domain/TonB dependent receptor
MQTSQVAAVLRLIAVAAVTLSVNFAEVAAQGTTGSISGFVMDSSKSALPGATVAIKDVDTGKVRTITTDDEGRYRADGLAPGKYDVTVELSGFRTAEYESVAVSVGQALVLNVEMAIGGMSERVVVTADKTVVQTKQASLTALVDQSQIRELPLNGRDFSQLTLLQAGVTASPSTSQQVDRGMGTQVSIAGARPNQISYQLDGTDANTQGNGSPGSAAGGLLGVDTVREFQVLVNNYSAEYGRSAGGIVTAITRSGTNVMRGSVFEFNRDSAFDAKTFFDSPDQDIPELSRNQFGGNFGGRIVKDRTFFFGSYEGLRQDRGTTTIATVPSRATRARTDISPVTLPYLMIYPEPNGKETGSTGQYTFQSVAPTRENYALGRVDHQFTQNQSIAVRYSWDKARVDIDAPIPLWTTDTRTRAQSIVGEHKWLLSATLLNVVKMAWNQAFESTDNLENTTFDPSLYFVPGTRFGTLSVSGINGLGPDTNTPTFVDLKSFQLIDDLTWSRGAHNLKTGLSVTHFMNDQDSSFTFGGSYSFTSLENFIRNIPGTYEGQAEGSTTARRWRQNLIGMYVQDDWSMSRNLTLNLGLRYEFITTPNELDGREASMPDLQAANTTPGGPIFKNPSYKNVAPRVGFAWDMTGNAKNVLRGGAGYFFEPILSNIYRAYGNRTPPYYNAINPANPSFPHPPTSGTSSQLRLDLVQYDLNNPYRLQYNLTYQRELWARTIATVGYIGSRGYQQFRNVEYNQAIPIIQPDGSYFWPADSARRNANFGSMRLRSTDGESWYNGLVLAASRRFSAGLAMQASYTFAKSEDLGSQAVGSGDFDNSFQPAYTFDPESNKGFSDFDIRHNFVYNATWELPFGKGMTGVSGALANGWQLSGIFTARSGIPFSPVLGFDRARVKPRSGGAGQRPDLVAGCSENPVLGGAEQYFDTSCFALPVAGTLGNLARNTIIGPGYVTLDMAIFKNFTFGTGRRLQFRAESFNVTNHVNFGLPASTVFNSGGPVTTAGQITTIVGTARQFQFGVKLEF